MYIADIKYSSTDGQLFIKQWKDWKDSDLEHRYGNSYFINPENWLKTFSTSVIQDKNGIWIGLKFRNKFDYIMWKIEWSS
jgi:hypothetical protein